MSTKQKINPVSDLDLKLKVCEPEVQHFVAALKKENLRLHLMIAKLEADKVSLESKTKVAKHNHTPIKLSVDEIKKIQKQIIKEIKKELDLES